MMTVSEYNLPDLSMLKDDSAKSFIIWKPENLYIILGASNHAEDALYLERVVQDNIIVMKRRSGGQTVMLTPNNLVIAAVLNGDSIMRPKFVFDTINSLIISAIEETGLTGLTLKGISDIAIAGKKILGSAIYKNKEKLLYHAVLNFSEPPSTFEKYLQHPSKEPDYRAGRNHTDFVTSLTESGYVESFEHLTAVINSKFESSQILKINRFNNS